MQLINTLVINCKNRWSNKAELENRKFFVYAHNCDSGVICVRKRMALIGYGSFLNTEKTTLLKTEVKIHKTVESSGILYHMQIDLENRQTMSETFI